jgi:hypothetical protein
MESSTTLYCNKRGRGLVKVVLIADVWSIEISHHSVCKMNWRYHLSIENIVWSNSSEDLIWYYECCVFHVNHVVDIESLLLNTLCSWVIDADCSKIISCHGYRTLGIIIKINLEDWRKSILDVYKSILEYSEVHNWCCLECINWNDDLNIDWILDDVRGDFKIWVSLEIICRPVEK